MSSDSEKLQITTDDLVGVEPVADARRPPRPRPPVSPARPPRNVPAIAAFVVALLGIPLPGVVLGPVAVVLGVLGLTGSRAGRSAGLAAAGILLGVLDLGGWLFFLTWHLLGSGGAAQVQRPHHAPRSPVPALLANAPALSEVDRAPTPVRLAIRANVQVSYADATGFVVRGGSGVLIGRSGRVAYVLTNRHVVTESEAAETSGSLRAVLADGARSGARVLWIAPERVDLAILEIGPVDTELEPVRLNSRARSPIGAEVFAIGNPLGYEATYTRGVVSSVRTLSVGARDLRVYQTQASINPGNSGGGLYDEEGALLGVVTWHAEGGEGIGFAIGAEGVVELLEQSQAPWVKEVTR